MNTMIQAPINIIRYILSLLIMIVMGVEEVWAQTTPSKWDGTNPTTTWDAANRTAAGITGTGTEADPYLIKDAKGFVYFWWAANNGSLNSSTQYWTLDADIDLDNRTWPYVNKNGNFKGKFDGQNHTISNIKLEPATANYNYGLFCVIQGANATNHAEVKNLTISNTTIAPSADLTKTTSIGILAGKADSNVDITNVTISGINSITYAKKINDENYIGGLLGQITGANTTVTNCHVSSLTMTAKSTTTNAYFAGLIGRINAQGTVTNCSTTDITINYELIANASRIAGLVGNSKGTNTDTPTVISGCTATRTKINLPNGINNGCYIGAFIGQVNSNQQKLTNNTVDSPVITIGTDIKAASYIGGAIGDFAGSSADYMGSLNGLTVTSPSVTVDKVSVKDNYIGAVFGRINTYSTLDDVDVSDPTLTYKNTGAPNFALNLGSFAGGIFGNAAQETAVTNIDVTGDATVTIGSSNNVQNVKAGLIGQSTTNVRLEGWTIENTTVDVKGSLATAAGQLGGFIGYIKSAANAPINVNDIDITGTSTVSVSGNVSIGYQLGGFVGYIETVANGDLNFSNTKITGNSSVTVTGTISASSHLGGFAGQIATGNQANHLLTIDGAGVEGTSTVSLGGNMTTASSYFGGFVGLVQGRSQVNNIIKIANVTNGISNITITGTLQDKAGYVGGLAGYVTQGIKLDNWTVKTAANIALNGNVTVASYVGGAIGDFTAVSGYTSSIDGLNVSKPVVTINKVSKENSYIGAVFGRIGNYVSVANASSSSPTLTYNNTDNPNVVLNLGSFAGGIVGVATAATTVTDVTVTGEAKVTIGTGTSNISNIKAGLIGNASVSARLNNWSVDKTTVHIKGALATTTSYFGGFVGNMTGGDVLSVNTVNINKVDLTVDGNIGIASYLGGFAGVATSNCQLNDMHIKEEVKLNFGATINTSSYLGGGFGNLAGAAALATTASNISVTNPTIVLGVIAPAMYVGGLAGQVTTNCSLYDWTANTPIITLNQPIKTASYIGGGIGNFVGGVNLPSIASGIKVNNAKVTIAGVGIKDVCIGNMFGRIQTYSTIENSTSTNSTLTFNGDIALNLHLGDVAGYVTGAVTQLKNVTSKDAKIAINGNVTANSLYLGALTGYQTLSDIRESTVDGADIALNGNNASNMYVGGAVGYMNPTAAPITTLEQVVVKNSKIHTVGSHTYAKGNKALVIGGVAGYVGHSSATTLAEVNKCVTENIDINLSGFIPEAANTSGSLYNQQQNAFVIGGVIGRINTPYSLPEHLYFSGKIYAPFAAVGPVVGVFYNNVGAATYLYDDYSGENASKLPAGEWDKADTWYFSNYQLGLSPEVLSQTARTKNFTASTTNIDGIEYLTIEESTLTDFNAVGAAQKHSKTILNYSATSDIVPAWNTGSATYPAYYMYYMQGVNRATFNDEIDIEKVLIGFAFAPLLNRTGNDDSGYVFTVDLNGFDPGTDYTITYQWYKSDKTTPIAGGTSSSLSISKDDLDAAGGSVYCVVTATADGIDPFNVTLQGSYKIVVFVDASKGVDNIVGSRTRGWTPTTAVKTLDNANLLLYSPEEGGTIDNNYIVIIGTLSEIQSSGKNPATLTGVWEGTDYKGIIKIKQINPGAGENAVNPANQPGKKGSNCYVLADTKFEYLTFQANSNTDGNNFIECHGNDVWFGKGLVMTNFANLSKNHGNLEAAQNIPELSIILTATNLCEEDIRKYTKRTKPQVVTFESGHYGRILGGRFTGGFFNSADNTSHAILGSAEHPVWAVVNIDIDKENPNKGTVNRKESPNTGVKTDDYTCDINCIIAGLTDGSMYGDYEINVHGGQIGYIVGGNQGNPVPNGSKTFTQPGGKSGNWGQWPNSSYLGRTVINVEQDDKLKDIVIDNLYAGGLGREANGDAATSIVDMYMYGHTEINMKSGTITGNIYGGGAGGVIGLNPWDMHVPYVTTDADNVSNAIMNNVQYGEWGAKKAGDALANVTLHDSYDNGGYITNQLNLGESYTTLNISGGTINGSVYGGGCGYVSNMPKEVVMQGVGSVFGTSNVNISGGKILGSVYGGSEGSNKYFGAVNKYNQTINHIAEMNGTVNLKVTGTESQYPTIGGNIYGAGMGIASNGTEEYLRIATAGNSELGGDTPDRYKTDINILIDLPDSKPFNGNIYGGGQMGAVDGKTHVTIKGGVFEKDIFGAGKGEDGHINKAKVTGTSGVTIDGGSIQSTVYGGGALAIVDGDTEVNLNDGILHQDVFGGGMGELNADHTTKTSADVTGTAAVTANGSTFDFPENGIDKSVNHNIYGGGNFASVVGATNVTINQGLLKAGFLDGDASSSWGKWIDAVNDQTDNVVQGSVFGGGYGVNTIVTNTAAVSINVADDADNKAMIDVIGGGYNGYVLSNTDVTVSGAAEIYKVYGGGLGSYDGYVDAPTEHRSHANLSTFTKQQTIGSVGEGKEDDGTSVTILGGKIYDNIFGGGAGLKYANGNSYLNVAEVFGKSNVIVDAITYWDEDHTFGNKIYGGGALGLVNDKILVDIKSGTFSGAEFFAGSLGEKGHLDKAKVTASATVRTSANDSDPVGALLGYFNVYGGCDMAQMEGDTHVELQHGTFSGSIFGAGKGLPSDGSEEYLEYGKVTGATTIVIDEPSLVLGQAGGLDTDGKIIDNTKAIKIYGGGALGLVDGTINPVTLKSGTLYGEVFGGSLGELGHPNKAKIMINDADAYLGVRSEASTTNLDADGKPATLNGNINIYGGCDMALVEGNTKVEIKHGTFTGQMFGGGKGVASNIVDGVDTYAEHGKVKGETTIIYNNDGTFNGNVYGGGALGAVIPVSDPADGYTTEIYLKKGVLNGHVFGGGYGESINIDKAKVVGNTYITTREMDSPTDVLSGSMNHIYGGGDMAMVDGNTNIDFTRGSFNGEIFGGGHGIEEDPATEKDAEQYLDFGKVTGTTNVTIDGGTLGTNNDNENEKIRIYGGGALGLVGTGINIVVKSGEHYGEIFGGSLGEEGHPNKAVISGDSYLHTEANTNKDPLTGNIKFYGGCNLSQVTGNSRVLINHGTFGGAVFGGGKGVSGSKEYGNIGGNTSVLIKGGDTRADVYGGGALGNVLGKTDVDLAGGAVKDVYGGGLGDASTEAIVYGDALVTLNGSTVDGVANDCKVYGSIFGCNNVNGTPKGHAKVHVLKTMMRDGQDTSPENQNVSDAIPSYHVAGVYGGGNHAAYQPTSDDDFAEVLIENCDNSIAYVYGGGNAAPVPATKVTIYGANAIDHAFAGGNGAGAGNPGADVGYLGYHSSGSNVTYGSGNAEINVLGGTVHNIYGGSNTLGYIRTGTSVSVKQEGDCPLVVGNVYGGGNEADIDGNITINLDCDKGSDLLYAGANNADVNGNITLNVYSGTFGKLFCGNNTGGAVRGKLTVNVDETGCWPVMIGELYGGGNQAGYSVYGYEVDGEGKTLRDADGHVVVKTEGKRQYADPEVNLYSFTRIGKVFGGGYGETAVLYGNTHVNVEPISGIYADGTAKPDFVLDSTDESIRVPNTQTVLEVLGADKIGSIGSIYGGGNAGAVYGNTEVKIGTLAENHHINGNDELKAKTEEVVVTITGNVFGGGNEAIVSGDTYVTIGQ